MAKSETADAGQADGATRVLAKLWWLSVIRGLPAFLLGLALLVAPAGGRPLLAQYMGMYWLANMVY